MDGETWSVLREEMQPPPVLLICGGGHIALPLSRPGNILALGVVVIDDRPSFANPLRFPEADQVICAPFTEALVGYAVDGETYVPSGCLLAGQKLGPAVRMPR